MACGVYLRGMNLAFIRDVDSAGFLLGPCVHSPWAIAGCPGQHNCFGSKPKEANPIQTNLERYGRFGPDVRVIVFPFFRLFYPPANG